MKKRLRIAEVCSLSMLTALSIVATRVLGVQYGQFLRLSFGGVPIILAGIVFGPVPGAMVGIAADLIGFMLNPMGGAYFPGFTLTSALTGFIPPLILRLGSGPRTAGKLFGAVAVTQVVTNVCLNSWWLYIMFGPAMWARFPIRVANQGVMIPLYTVGLYYLLAALEKSNLVTATGSAN